MQATVIPGLDAAAYSRHALHAESATWSEKNCYVDLWIELLHALKLEPCAMLPFVLSLDFEGDQWTFYKPVHDELFALYGVDVQELTVWKPLLEHAIEHLPAGRLISTEADAYWLPDTSGTDYRTKHTKTTIVLNSLDVANKRLSYFHNAGYYTLQGEDFDRTFKVGEPHDEAFLPLFAEFVRLGRIVRRSPTELTKLSWQLLGKHLERRPTSNPVAKFRARFEQDLASMQERGLAFYHAWAFATTRQLGSAFEIAAANLRWMTANGIQGLELATEAFDQISADNKAFILKGARSVNSKKPVDLEATFGRMTGAWDRGMASLVQRTKSPL